MIVLDAQALLGYLLREPAADRVAALLHDRAAMCAVNAAEVLDVLTRKGRIDPRRSAGDWGLIQLAGVAVIPAWPETGSRAGRIRATHYHRSRRSLSLAGAFAAATALEQRMPLATADRALAMVVRAEGGAVIDLPDSAGRLPG